MPKAKDPFKTIIKKLAARYGPPAPPLSDAYELLLWESSGYLVEDDKRQAAFDELRREVGLKPTTILEAPTAKLEAIMRHGGIHPDKRALRLKEIAHITLNDFDGDLRPALRLPLPQAIKALRKFPSIAEPGAEKILLFTHSYPVLGPESNGLRVLLRLGYGQESKNYSTSYASVRRAVQDQLGDDCEFLIVAHQLLRRHGKECCKTNRPLCRACPVLADCAYGRKYS
jgi:endonuclease III